MGSHELSERSRRLLATLVREYIETGEPVASQCLARESGLGVSSATVRSVLAQLEEGGYVLQPHTSAGRVPTDRGYRVFVDLLLEGRKRARPPAVVEHRLREQAERSPLIDDLLASVSHLVSRAARHAGFARLPLLEVREAVLARLQQERTLYDELLARALRLARSTLEELPSHHAFHVEGAASLLAGPANEGVSLATLRALVEMMEEKERLVHLLNQYIEAPGLTIVIGAEHAAPDLRPFSLIASTEMDGSTVRTVGVIGPTRMHYSRAISLVDGTTQAV